MWKKAKKYEWIQLAWRAISIIRLMDEENVEAKDKLISIFETHSDISAKGKRKVAFGHKILLSGGKSNLILDCVIERGNWSDAECFGEGIDRLKERYLLKQN